MTLKRELSPTGTEHVRWLSCPFCESAIGPQESFAQHYAGCPNNPEADQ